jgi:ApbE superfamily uncharacterized protein (UPF0280 family)
MIYTETPCLLKRNYNYKQSNCTIISDVEPALDAAVESITVHREKLGKYVVENPVFHHSFEPVIIDEGPKIVLLMAEAAQKAGVGPMAAVAGVIADLAVEAMANTGARVAIVEYGGEASIKTDRKIDVALQAGDAPLSRRLGFRIVEGSLGIATSSGLFSHAWSFGESEAVTVFAENAGIADAAATSVGNVITGNNEDRVISEGLKRALGIEGVSGVLISYRGKVGTGGTLPELIEVTP